MGLYNNNDDIAFLYRRWIDMKARCYNKSCCNYKYYGARGIKICDEWLGKDGFNNFLKWSIDNGFKKELSIDRINNNGDYKPNNCRWTTKSIQNMSRRTKNISGYIGISKHSNGVFWYGRVRVNKKQIYTGMSKDIKEAVKMRNDYIISHNLPNELNEV